MPGAHAYRRFQRLRSPDISSLLAGGRRRRAPAVTVQVRANGGSIARLGLIVPKRHIRRAVDRNRMKRLLREWFRLKQHALAGRDLLIRVTAPVGCFESVVVEVDRLIAADS